jgi:glycosyltransferase involved in cell wall biosynthesis
VIDEKTGLLCPPKDADALADALARLLHDPQQRARLRQEAREKVSADFDCTREADKLARLFEASA